MQRSNNSSRSAFRSSIDMECSVFSSEEIPMDQHQSDAKCFTGFLENLHRLLDEHSIGSSGQRIVSWNADGLSFQIHDVQKFERLLIPLYFGNDRTSDFHARTSSATQTMPMSMSMSSGLESFLNRVRDYGFYRIETNNIYRNTFSHPLFVRGKKKLIVRMGNISNQEQQSLTVHRNSWPMPALGPLQMIRQLEKLDEVDEKMTATATATATTISYDSSSSSRTSLLLDSKQKSSSNMSSKFVVPTKSSAAQSIDKPFSFRQALQRRKRPSKTSARNNSWSQAGDLDFLIDLTTDDNDNDNDNDDITTPKSKVVDFDDWMRFDFLHHHQQQHQQQQQQHQHQHQQPTTLTSVEPLDLLVCDEDSLLGDDIAEALSDLSHL